MDGSVVSRAVAAAKATAAALGLRAEDAVVLHDSNKLTVRLLPCDVLARVAPAAEQVAQFELDLAQQLLEAGCPVAAPDPRVAPRAYERDGFVITLWTYYEPVGPGNVPPAAYAGALARLHAGMRTIEIATPHCIDRVDSALQLVADHDQTPDLADEDRELLAATLRDGKTVIVESSSDQLLHGEPHPGNLLTTTGGLRFIDLETCCRGPVEFDLAHAPDAISDHYPSVDHGLLRECRILVLAMITTWRWDRNDQFPNGRNFGTDWLNQIRAQRPRR